MNLGHSLVCMLQGAEKSQPPEVGIEPVPLDLKANTVKPAVGVCYIYPQCRNGSVQCFEIYRLFGFCKAKIRHWE